MLKDYKLLAVVSLLAAVATFLAIGKASKSEFAGYQKEYFKLCDVEGDVAIRQLNVRVGSETLIDRCATCHVGFDNPNAAAFSQPLTLHPQIVPGEGPDPHDLGIIGCVVCHDGNGRATTTEDAHGHFHMWPAPLLTGDSVQANCICCHDTNAEPLAGAGTLNRGRKLFAEKVCWSCHTIEGVSRGKIGPDLTDVGARFNMDYLYESIVHPAANIASSRMPQFDWTDKEDDVHALTVYLKSQRRARLKNYDQAPIGTVTPILIFDHVTEARAENGRRIFMGEQGGEALLKGGCVNCHTVRESDGLPRGGKIGPELTYTGRARDEAYLKAQVRNSRGHAPDSVMPTFEELTDVEVDSLIAYLRSLDYVDEGATTGERVYATYCVSCHGEDLSGRGTNYRLLDPYPRNLSRHQFVQTYKSRFTDSLMNGIEGTAMPPWKLILTEAQMTAVIDYITERSAQASDAQGKGSFVRLKVELPHVGDVDRVTEKAIAAADPVHGKSVFMLHCTGCHGKLANGKGPNAYTLGNVYPRNLLNDSFMARAAVDDERLYRSILLGVPGTPMPSHSHLGDQTLMDMIAYIRTLND